jgi:hypothetical protein
MKIPIQKPPGLSVDNGRGVMITLNILNFCKIVSYDKEF